MHFIIELGHALDRHISQHRLAGRLEQAVQAVKQAVSQSSTYDVLVPALLKSPFEVGIDLLSSGLGVKPHAALAQPLIDTTYIFCSHSSKSLSSPTIRT